MKENTVIKLLVKRFQKSICSTNIFIASEPLKGKRYVEVTERKTKIDWAIFIKIIADEWYKNVKKIILVIDNLANT